MNPIDSLKNKRLDNI